MMVGEIPTADPHAALRIGLVFAQAVVLYVGYGAAERVVRPRLLRVLRENDNAARN